jgi:hypothetical protein
VIDSVYFGPQSPDISYYRCPNGIGNFSYTLSFTFNQSNCPTAINELGMDQLTIYPIPSQGSISIKAQFNINNVKVFDLTGKCVLNVNIGNENNYQMELPGLHDGLYLLQINNSDLVKRIQIIK